MTTNSFKDTLDDIITFLILTIYIILTLILFNYFYLVSEIYIKIYLYYFTPRKAPIERKYSFPKTNTYQYLLFIAREKLIEK